MIYQKNRLLLEYNTYPIWLCNEGDEIIDNDNPPKWDNDQQLTNAFMAANDLYDTFFIDNEKKFAFIGYPDTTTADRLKDLMTNAIRYLEEKTLENTSSQKIWTWKQLYIFRTPEIHLSKRL